MKRWGKHEINTLMRLVKEYNYMGWWQWQTVAGDMDDLCGVTLSGNACRAKYARLMKEKEGQGDELDTL